MPNNEDLAAYVHFLSGTSNFAISPDALGPQGAGFPNCSTEGVAWILASYQIHGNLVDPEWASAAWLRMWYKFVALSLVGWLAALDLCSSRHPRFPNFLNFGASSALVVWW